MYFFDQLNVYEDEGTKVFLDDNMDNMDLDFEKQLNGGDQEIMNDKEINNNDLFITNEDNEQRYLIKVEKEKENQNKTDINQMTTTMKSTIKDGQNQNLKINETPETNTPKSNNHINKEMENSRKIFNISKVNKKMGRMLKRLKKKFKAPHNKYSEDNIIRKIKARFQDLLLHCINFENSKFLEAKGVPKKIKLLQRINPEESRKISKADNLRWFSTKLKDLFSSDLSKKCSLYDSDYNRRKINEIYKNNEAIDVINILEKEVIDMYNLYRNNVKIEGFITLEEDLKILREKMEKENEEDEEDIELYLSNYKDIALRLDKIFEDKKGRDRKSKKISLKQGNFS